MQQQTSENFELVDWQVNPALNQLSIDDQVFELEPKVMQLLVCLKEHDGELVTKDTLFEEVWHGVSISDDAIYCGISKLRKIFRQAEEHRSPKLKTITRQGYMLCNRPPYKVLDAQSLVKNGRRHDDQHQGQELKRRLGDNRGRVERSEDKNDISVGSKIKRLVRNSELKLLNIELYVDENKSNQRGKVHKLLNKKLKILLLILLLVILIQAFFILFV